MIGSGDKTSAFAGITRLLGFCCEHLWPSSLRLCRLPPAPLISILILTSPLSSIVAQYVHVDAGWIKSSQVISPLGKQPSVHCQHLIRFLASSRYGTDLVFWHLWQWSSLPFLTQYKWLHFWLHLPLTVGTGFWHCLFHPVGWNSTMTLSVWRSPCVSVAASACLILADVEPRSMFRGNKAWSASSPPPAE